MAIARMMANTLLDTTVGAIPILGDAFDVMFRANMKNMALLRQTHGEAWSSTGGPSAALTRHSTLVRVR